MTTATRETILQAAIELSIEKGYPFVSREDVARRAGVGTGTVSLHFKDMDNLRQVVLRTAVAKPIIEIARLGLAMREPIVLQAPIETRTAIIEHLINL